MVVYLELLFMEHIVSRVAPIIKIIHIMMDLKIHYGV